MTNLLLYWNHICVLHKQEKAFLERLAEALLSEGICLQVRYFGLGYPEHMSEYLARPDAVLPDLIVSADLEVFEDSRIFRKFKDSLYPAARWASLKNDEALKAVWRSDSLLPFLSIPLVYYTREPEICARTPLADWNGLAFGGINNSAVKTVAKAVWDKFGKSYAEALLEKSTVTDMPIGAFQAVRMGSCKTALVPSLYALRADQSDTFLCTPLEGPVLIPSYICARKSAPEEAARRVIQGILGQELCDFYAENGDLILHQQQAKIPSRQETSHYLTPSADWLSTLSLSDFYQMYCKKLPTAREPFAASV